LDDASAHRPGVQPPVPDRVGRRCLRPQLPDLARCARGNRLRPQEVHCGRRAGHCLRESAMPNPLTGDFDALIQVSEGTVNRLLAALHQHEPGGSEAPSLPHKAVIRIDDDPVFGGAPAGVRGVAYVQVGVPMVSVVPGVTQADVSMWVRSWYRPDPGTTVLPEFVHAKVTVRVGVVFEHTPGGLAARVTLPEDDSAVVLTEHGLLPADAGLVATVVRWFIRNRLDAALPLGDALPDGVGAPLTVID